MCEGSRFQGTAPLFVCLACFFVLLPLPAAAIPVLVLVSSALFCAHVYLFLFSSFFLLLVFSCIACCPGAPPALSSSRLCPLFSLVCFYSFCALSCLYWVFPVCGQPGPVFCSFVVLKCVYVRVALPERPTRKQFTESSYVRLRIIVLPNHGRLGRKTVWR